MREIIQIQIGQCGNQVGYKFWEKISKEHYLQSDGTLSDLHRISNYSTQKLEVFFREGKQGKYKARNVLTDIDSESLDYVQSLGYAQLFDVDNYIFGEQSNGSNWAKVYHDHGAQVMKYLLETIRREVERSDSPQGLQLVHSVGGGVGGGLGSLLIEHLKDDYPKQILESFTVVGSKDQSGISVEPYNSILGMEQLIENVDLVHLFSNSAIFSLLMQEKEKLLFPIEVKEYEDVSYSNLVLCQAISGIISIYRFPNQLYSSKRSFATAMIPFPRLHFLSSGLTHLPKPDQRIDLKHCLEKKILYDEKNFTAYRQVIKRVHCGAYSLNGALLRSGVYMSLMVQFRSSQVAFDGMILGLINQLRKRAPHNFTSWIPDNVKGSLYFSQDQSEHLVNSATYFGVSCGIKECLLNLSAQFAEMFNRKEDLQVFIENGVEEMDLLEADSNLYDLISDFQAYSMNYGEEENDQFEVQNLN